MRITNTPGQRGMDDVSWATIIQRLAGPNDRFPGRPVYCLGSLGHMDESWLQAVGKQARERGWEALDGDGDLYLVGPKKRIRTTYYRSPDGSVEIHLGCWWCLQNPDLAAEEYRKSRPGDDFDGWHFVTKFEDKCPNCGQDAP